MKGNYRAIKYVWNPEWIGTEGHKAEILAAKRACISEIASDWAQDQEVEPTEAQIKLTIMHISKYASCTVQRIDNCYSKVMVAIMRI